jgi:hypothetical protein
MLTHPRLEEHALLGCEIVPFVALQNGQDASMLGDRAARQIGGVQPTEDERLVLVTNAASRMREPQPEIEVLAAHERLVETTDRVDCIAACDNRRRDNGAGV